jgi:3-deoxy-D-manno-octulosonic-acid transferase
MRSRNAAPDAHTGIYIVDTLGELGLVYRLASIVFMGGSLAAHGGQNPVEAIKHGAAILHGPHVWNFAEIYDALDRAGGAEQVADAGRLATRAGAWLADAKARHAAADAAQQTVKALSGALNRTLAALDPYLMQLRLEPGMRHA